MNVFRVYEVRGSRLIYHSSLNVETEELAAALAADALEGRAGELWHGGRLVKKIPADLAEN